MYPKDRIRDKTQQMPPNLMTLFAHVMSRANEGGSRGSAAAHGWDEVLNAAASSSSSSPSSTTSSSSSSSSGTISPGPCCPMSAQDWRKAEAFSVHLQSLLAARDALCGSNGSSSSSSRGAGATTGGSGQSNGASSSSYYGPQSGAEGRCSPASSGPADGREPSPFPGGRKDSTPHANGRAKGGRAKAPAAPSGAAATPNNAAGTAWPQHVPGATPKESSSRGGGEEPSAPIKAVGRVAVSRRVNGGAEGAVASLAVSRAGPGAFETPAHSTSHHHHHLHNVHHHADRAGAAGVPGTVDSSGGGGGGGNNSLRGREHSPSRYPARLRSRRFPQLGGGGESPESQPPPHHHHRAGDAGADGLEGHQSQGGRRLSPRHSPPASVGREHGRGIPSDARRQHNAHGWVVTAGAEKRAAGAGGGGSGSGSGSRGEEEGGVFTHDGGRGHEGGGGRAGEGYGMRTRAAAPKGSYELGPAAVASSGPSSSPLPGACTPQITTGAVVSPVPMDFRPAPPPIMSAAAAAAAVAAVAAGRPSPRAEVAAPRPRQVLQGGGRSGGRAAPLPRSSVGGRNYTDNHVKQLGLIEAAVVASATARDRATYNLPRQGRTLTLTNVFKFIALRGAGAMYRLAMDKQVEAHTGRHSNFFDGKIDARIVGVIKKDIGDEAITKSRKFSKILLSLVAEGCTHPDCDWDHTSFTSEKIANLQARMEASTGTSALKFCADPAVFLAAAAAAAAAATPSGSSSARGGGGGSGCGSGSIPSSPLSGSAFAGGGASSAAAGGGSSSGSSGGGAHSKRRLDLGRDDDGGQTPSPRLKKLKRAARARVTTAGSAAADGGVESTPTAEGNSKSPPKEEDDMRAAEVLQGLKDIVGSQ
ncbi:expressed unknown protein [Ectocarpus siliculosus]|uniref:Uncharacterized protein n=1 Tax=Ectocarpus siliculosus TaxID=2880 RepID=D7G1A2_ECTSI|nr:expressed unknown protein [Ectocarpus siliculosus]|eukprot:CBJ33212.1 expressed unknown protein [Ectocarpus siliculosus]